MFWGKVTILVENIRSKNEVRVFGVKSLISGVWERERVGTSLMWGSLVLVKYVWCDIHTEFGHAIFPATKPSGDVRRFPVPIDTSRPSVIARHLDLNSETCGCIPQAQAPHVNSVCAPNPDGRCVCCAVRCVSQWVKLKKFYSHTPLQEKTNWKCTTLHTRGIP